VRAVWSKGAVVGVVGALGPRPCQRSSFRSGFMGSSGQGALAGALPTLPVWGLSSARHVVARVLVIACEVGAVFVAKV